MQKISGKLKIYLCTSIIVAALTAILLTLSVFLSYDASPNYLRPALIPYVFEALLIVSIIFALSAFFTIPKNELSGDSPITLPVSFVSIVFAAILAAAAVIVYCVALNFGSFATDFASIASVSPTLLLVTGILTLISIVYFTFNCFVTDDSQKYKHALLGFAIPLTAALYVSISYFDISVSMNAPIKLLFHYSLISFMIWSLYELRAIIGKPMPRVYFVFGLITLIFSASASIPWLIAFGAGKLTGSVFPSYILYTALSLAACIYTATRLIVFVSARSLIERLSEQTPEDEETFEFEKVADKNKEEVEDVKDDAQEFTEPEVISATNQEVEAEASDKTGKEADSEEN